jgi:hypothetical protein
VALLSAAACPGPTLAVAEYSSLSSGFFMVFTTVAKKLARWLLLSLKRHPKIRGGLIFLAQHTGVERISRKIYHQFLPRNSVLAPDDYDAVRQMSRREQHLFFRVKSASDDKRKKL